MGIISKSNYGHIVGICLMVLFFVPHTNIILYLLPLVAYVLLYATSLDNRGANTHEKLLVIISFLITFTIYILTIDIYNTKSILSFLSFIVIFSLFPTIDTKIPPGYFYFAICYVLVSQISYILNIGFINTFFDTLYPVSDNNAIEMYNQQYASFENIENYRLSGLWRSPNNTSREITLLYAFYILNNYKRLGTSNIIFIALCTTSTLLTGSRTGLFIMVLLTIYYYLIADQVTTNTKKYILPAIFTTLLVIIFSGGLVRFRGFELSEGFGNSANPKLETLISYLQTADNINLLFGNFDASLFQASAGNIRILDSEYGYLIYQYGLIGFIAYLIFIIVCVIKTNKKLRGLYFVFLWVISNSILFAYRSSFIWMLLLSSIILHSEKLNKSCYAKTPTNKLNR